MHKELIERLRTLPVFDDTTIGNEAADAIEALQAEHERMQAKLQNSITRRQEQMASADFAVASLKTERDEYQKSADAMAWSHKVERDTLRHQLAEAQAEIKSLQVEVCNRNRRALEGDKAEAAFDQLYMEHEELRIQVEASRKQEAKAFFCHGNLYIYPSEDPSCGHIDKHENLYAAPVIPEDVQRDAERYRWLRDSLDSPIISESQATDAMVDKAIAAMKGDK